MERIKLKNFVIGLYWEGVRNLKYIHPKKYKIIGIENIEFFTEREKPIEDIEMNNTSIDDYFTDNEY